VSVVVGVGVRYGVTLGGERLHVLVKLREPVNEGEPVRSSVLVAVAVRVWVRVSEGDTVGLGLKDQEGVCVSRGVNEGEGVKEADGPEREALRLPLGEPVGDGLKGNVRLPVAVGVGDGGV
jgi:hypothetical protein